MHYRYNVILLAPTGRLLFHAEREVRLEPFIPTAVRTKSGHVYYTLQGFELNCRINRRKIEINFVMR